MRSRPCHSCRRTSSAGTSTCIPGSTTIEYSTARRAALSLPQPERPSSALPPQPGPQVYEQAADAHSSLPSLVHHDRRACCKPAYDHGATCTTLVHPWVHCIQVWPVQLEAARQCRRILADPSWLCSSAASGRPVRTAQVAASAAPAPEPEASAAAARGIRPRSLAFKVPRCMCGTVR